MSELQAPLINLEPNHDYLIAIDSDGCVYDTMEIKQKECFVPNTIKHWKLQSVSKYARAAIEFVNLYSKWRGSNRFLALVKVFDFLSHRTEVRKSIVELPDVQSLRAWIGRETKLGNPALRTEIERTGDSVLRQTLNWSNAVNAAIEDMVSSMPPFPLVRESLDMISEWADIIVCSGTPYAALTREWEENNLDSIPMVIAGQEMGTKKEQIGLVSGKYPKGHVIMLGDALGDLKAAQANGLLFYPVNPGGEEKSWELFHDEVADAFRNGKYAGNNEAAFVVEFERLLPEIPPWEK